MKKTIKFTYASSAVLAIAALLIAACNDFLDVNTDPTRLKTASVTQALTAAQVSMTFYQGSDLFLYSSIFSQQATGSGVTGTQTRNYDQYILTNTDVNNAYTNYYAGSLADFDYVRKQAFKEGNPQYAGIAKILQAYTFSTLVDAWGDVPYKEALKGVSNVQPKYDGSKEIYDSLLVLIDAGIANTKQTNIRTVASEDLIYGGVMSRWEKYANTLKLRLALHYAKDDGGTKLKALITAGGPFMTANTDNFQMVFENVNNRQNPLHQFEVSRGDYYAPSTVMVNMMNTKIDPRRPFYFTPSPTGSTYPFTGTNYVGFTSNSAQTAPNSRIHTYLRGAVLSDDGTRTPQGSPKFTSITYAGDAPLRMLTFAEYNFIRAEAIIMYGAGTGTTAEAQTFYQAGITASMQDAGVSGANIATYIAANGILTGTQAIDLQLIIEEKFVANYGVCMEPWTDWRRTTFPTIATSAAALAVANTVIPRILIYPLSEQQTNIANVPNRVSMALKSVFWDK